MGDFTVPPQPGPISRHRHIAQTPPVRLSAQATSSPLVETEPRSRRYLDAMTRLDATTDITPAEIQEIVDDIRRDFTDRWAALPLGLVSRCYLGEPFEVHTLTPDGGILEHYHVGQRLPGPLEAGRAHSLSGLHLAVEVYLDRLVCIRTDGTTVTLGGEDA
jgi:hypothetical protein